MSTEPQISLHDIYCPCEQCIWHKVQEAWAEKYLERAYMLGQILGMKTSVVRANSLDISQAREAFFARLAQVKRSVHGS